MGTDAAVGKHGTNAEELEHLTQIGMTPMEAIVASTRTASECIHDASNVGTLEVGKFADLLVVEGMMTRRLSQFCRIVTASESSCPAAKRTKT